MPSISITKGRGSLNHNKRKYHTPNVDKERSFFNRELVNLELPDVYHELFDDALERYNAKQKRSDRKINDYLQHVRKDKKTKEFHELVIQIGNKDDIQNLDPNDLADMLQQYLEEFQERNPQLKVFSAIIHMDEATPHLHLDYVPFVTGQKRGLDTKVAHDKALQQMGYSDYASWRANELTVLEDILHRNGYERTIMNNNETHRSVESFKRFNRELEAQISDLKPICEPLPIIATKKTLRGLEVVEKASIEPILADYQTLQARNSLLERQNQVLTKQNQEQNQIIAEMRSKRYRIENNELHQTVNEQSYDIRQLNNKLDDRENHIAELENKITRMPSITRYNQIVNKYNQNISRLKNYQEENTKLKQQLEQQEKSLKELKAKVSNRGIDDVIKDGQIKSLTDNNNKLRNENKNLKSLVNRLLHCIDTIVNVVTKCFGIDVDELDTEILETDERAWKTLNNDTNFDLKEQKREQTYTR